MLHMVNLVHDLHRATGLWDELRIVQPDINLGSRDRLERYHARDYLDAVLLSGDEARDLDDELKEGFGLIHDCPIFDTLSAYVPLVAAATSTACRQLAECETRLAIAWDGGRHHAQRDRASGFCYVADIVLGIMLLSKEGRPRTPAHAEPAGKERNRRARIMYIDLDLHNGDGVAKAFQSPTRYITDPSVTRKQRPPQVLTLSVHHSSSTFFPAPTPPPTGDTTSPFTLSVPLAAYPSCATYRRVLEGCVEPIRLAFDPDYVVVQMGADGLPGDRVGKLGGWDIDGVGGMVWYAKRIQDWGLPMCVLGGGGYHHANVGRAWTKLTAALIGAEIDGAVPHHDHYEAYGPSFQMDIDKSSVADQNSHEDLDELVQTYRDIASRIEDIVGGRHSGA